MPTKRPAGISSRMTRAPGERHPWDTAGVTIDLPVIVDWVNVDPGTGAELVRIEATIDLGDDEPAIISMSLVSSAGLDLVTLQRNFRWASPLEVVTGLAPRLIAEGESPYAVSSGDGAVGCRSIRTANAHRAWAATAPIIPMTAKPIRLSTDVGVMSGSPGLRMSNRINPETSPAMRPSNAAGMQRRPRARAIRRERTRT